RASTRCASWIVGCREASFRSQAPESGSEVRPKSKSLAHAGRTQGRTGGIGARLAGAGSAGPILLGLFLSVLILVIVLSVAGSSRIGTALTGCIRRRRGRPHGVAMRLALRSARGGKLRRRQGARTFILRRGAQLLRHAI